VRNLNNISTGVSSSGCHIASLIVLCHPDAFAEILKLIEAIPVASVPEQDPVGKLIVLIEAADEKQLMEPIRSIETFPGVISTSLVFHQIDH